MNHKLRTADSRIVFGLLHFDSVDQFLTAQLTCVFDDGWEISPLSAFSRLMSFLSSRLRHSSFTRLASRSPVRPFVYRGPCLCFASLVGFLYIDYNSLLASMSFGPAGPRLNGRHLISSMSFGHYTTFAQHNKDVHGQFRMHHLNVHVDLLVRGTVFFCRTGSV